MQYSLEKTCVGVSFLRKLYICYWINWIIFFFCLFFKFGKKEVASVHFGPCQIYMTELFTKIIYNFKPFYRVLNAPLDCNLAIIAAWKVSVFGGILVLIFPHSDWIREISEYGKIRTRITLNTDSFHAVHEASVTNQIAISPNPINIPWNVIKPISSHRPSLFLWFSLFWRTCSW